MSVAATPADVLAGNARWCVVEGDCAAVLRAMPDGCADALVSDPPSGIAFMGAEWDRNKGGRAQWVAWLAGILADARRATRDGGRALVWSLPRTSHWTGCAVEDAGWSIETTIAHLFGTGWPKGTAQVKPAQETWWLARTGRSEALNVDACRVGTSKRVPGGEPSQAANQVYGTASLRTADEIGRDPNVGRYPPNLLLSHSAGCICEGTRRVLSHGQRNFVTTGLARPTGYMGGDGPGVMTRKSVGVEADGLEPVEAWRCVEGCPVAELDRQSGERTSGVKVGGGYVNDGAFAASRGGGLAADGTACYGDTGTASRYFPQFPADDPDAPWNEALFIYAPKPSRAERGAGNDHPTVKSVALMRWLIRLVTKPGDVVLDPFGGSGTTGVAALLEGRRVVLIEREPQYAAIARARLAAADGSDWTAPIVAPTSAPRESTTRQLSLLDLLAGAA